MAVDGAHIEVVIVVEGDSIGHGAVIVQVCAGLVVWPKRIVIDPYKPAAIVTVVSYNHPICAIEGWLEGTCLPDTRSPRKKEPQVICYRMRPEYLSRRGSEDGARVRERCQVSIEQ